MFVCVCGGGNRGGKVEREKRTLTTSVNRPTGLFQEGDVSSGDIKWLYRV